MEKYDVYNQSGRKVGEIERREVNGGGGCGGCLSVLIVIGAIAISFYMYSSFFSGQDSVGDGWWLIALSFVTVLVHGIYLCSRESQESGGFFMDFITSSASMTISSTLAIVVLGVVSLFFEFSLDALVIVVLAAPIAGALASLAPAVIMGLIVALVRKLR